MLARILSSYAGYVKHVLTSEQKKGDFRPSEGGDADLFSCTQVRLNFISKFCRNVSFRDPPGNDGCRNFAFPIRNFAPWRTALSIHNIPSSSLPTLYQVLTNVIHEISLKASS